MIESETVEDKPTTAVGPATALPALALLRVIMERRRFLVPKGGAPWSQTAVRVTVRLFAVARQRAGSPELTLDLPEPATVGALKRVLAERLPDLAPLVPKMLFAVADDYADDDATIPPGAAVAAIPPVSGGAPRRGDDHRSRS
jgi:molybdopterin converting factor small subunit